MYFCISNSVIYEQEFQGDILYMMLYAVVAALNMVACCYLLLRRGNAFASDITSPLRLRRWTAIFFAAMTLSHLWYMPSIYLTSSDDKMLCYNIGGMLDSMTTFPLAIVILFTMLQDRRRPLWSAWLMIAPLVALIALDFAGHSEALMPIFNVYLLLLAIGLVTYMVYALRQYGRWLRDNYADLEHKEVWQSFVVLAVLLLGFGIYTFEIGGLANKYIVQVNNILLIGYLLWRVETLSDLSISQQQNIPAELSANTPRDRSTLVALPAKNIGPLLQQYCIDTQLYLQHDLSLLQLSKAIGTNRFYLSQYFSNQGTTYNAYINGGKDEMRNTLIHVYYVNEADYQRIADHNIYVSEGMLWHHAADEEIAAAPEVLPENLAGRCYPMKSFFDYGINISSHSDYPALAGAPDDPFGIMEIAVTGVKTGENGKPVWPEELITREQALTALTINVAKQMFVEGERGSISTGKYADFLLVDKDVLTCPVTEIHTAKPTATYFEGKKVFSM